MPGRLPFGVTFERDKAFRQADAPFLPFPFMFWVVFSAALISALCIFSACLIRRSAGRSFV